MLPIALLASSMFAIGLILGLMLRRRSPLAPSVLPRAGFSGSLDELSLASVLCLLEQEHKTGILQVQVGQTTGLFVCRAGQLTLARLEVHQLHEGATAVMELLRQRGGAFQFEARSEVVGEPMKQSITQMLLEGAQKIDEKG